MINNMNICNSDVQNNNQGSKNMKKDESMKNSTNQQPNYVTGSFVDPRDNRQYQTVKIGGKIWMAENLAYGGGVDPDKDPNLGSLYGFLYTLEEAKKACPPGWRLPTKEEFEELLLEFDSSSLKDESWHGSNSSGFGALPAGFKGNNGPNFYELGFLALFWSATPNTCFLVGSDAYLRWALEGEGFSVRCIKDGDGPDPRSRPSSSSNAEGSHWGSGAYHNEVDASGAWCDPDWTMDD